MSEQEKNQPQGEPIEEQNESNQNTNQNESAPSQSQECKELEELKKELHYLRQIKEALDKTTIISKTDPKGIITDANEMFEKISGYKKEELIGKPHNLVRHPEMPKSLFKKLWSTIQQGKIFKGVIKNKRKDGSDYYVLANIVPIKDEEGNIKEYIAIRQDITKRMQLQKEQENFLNNILEYFLKKFKSPANSIEKYSNLIEEELQKENPNLEDIRHCNNQIKKEGLTIQRMYKVLDLLIKFRNKEIKVSITPVNVPKTLSMLFKKYKNLYNKKVKFKIQSPEIIINTDRKLLTLLFDILYLNALKFSKQHVYVTIYEKDKNVIVIFESDSQEKLEEKVFDFVHQIKQNPSSTGLGMFAVKKIINFFDYKIKIEGGKIILSLSKLPPKHLI